MRYLKKYENHEYDIHLRLNDICKRYGIGHYTINDDMTIDVDGVFL
jgi:hypothetical protein